MLLIFRKSLIYIKEEKQNQWYNILVRHFTDKNYKTDFPKSQNAFNKIMQTFLFYQVFLQKLID